MFTHKSLFRLALLLLVGLFSVTAGTARAASAAIVAGSSFAISASVEGTAPFAYQWYKDGVAMSGATASIYQVNNTQTSNAGAYLVVISNSAGSTTSDLATITLATIPIITTQPVSQTVSVGNSVSFTTGASGSPAPTLQWKLNGTNISGATNPTLTVANVQSANAGTYTVVATNGAGSATSTGATLTVNPATVAPAFTTQPVSQTVIAGSAVTFTSLASGSPMPAYQWRKNGVNISGATSASYAVASASSTNAGTYSVVATNSAGSATSSNAVLTVNTAPVITTQPASQTVVAGNSASFTVAASGSPAPTFQWKRNGTNISGATGATLTLANVQSANAGTYTVVATNSAGSATSTGAILTVNAAATAPVFTTQPVSQALVAGNAVTFTSSASGSPTPTYQWRKNGVNISGATGAAHAITSATAADAGTYSVVATNSAGSVTSNNAVLTVNTAPVIATQPANQTVTVGNPVTFTVAAGGSPAPTYQWRKNSVAVSGATGATYSIASAATGDAGTYSVIVTNTVGSVTSANATLTVNATTSAPEITAQPASQVVAKGSSVTFSVAASGSPTLRYQWKKNGSNIRSATKPSYTLSNVSSSNAGTYTVVVSNSYGSVTSTGAVLSLTAVPAFTTQPVGQTASAGSAVTFTSLANGSPAPAYQWRKNGANISGATGSSYVIASAASADAGTYSVVATNSVGSATSNNAVLTIGSAPVITTQPASQTVVAGNSVSFTVAVSGSPPTFQWKRNGTNISGATSPTLNLSNVQSANAGTYTVVATNSAGSVTSTGATLTVNAAATAPVFTTQPSGQTIAVGNAVTFTSLASGSPTPTYQWRKNGVNISGATSASYVIPSATAADASTYSVVATNSAGSVTSNNAILTVNTAPVITTHPLNQTALVGASVGFTVAASGSPAPAYQWYREGVAISGATAATFTLAAVAVTDAASYTASATNSVGIVTSNAGTLTVNSAPSFITQPSSQSVTSGTNVTFTVTADGSPAPTYQWRKNGVAVAGATGSSYLLTAVSSADAGTYTVVLTNAHGTVTSSPATLTITATASPIVYRLDFNADGKSDILWQNLLNGDCRVWLLSGTSGISMISVETQPLHMRVCGGGDFNGDGKSDILVQNSTTGESLVWLMAGTTVASKVSFGALSLDWQLRGSGDFNGDGRSDLVWQNNTTGECRLWLMAGTTVSSTVSLGLASTDLMITGTGDFNKDGQSDILWQDSVTGAYGVWLMAGTTVGSNVVLGTMSLDWQMCGTGDFNGDSSSDLIWQNLLTGEGRVWLMNGTTLTSNLALCTVPASFVMRN